MQWKTLKLGSFQIYYQVRIFCDGQLFSISAIFTVRAVLLNELLALKVRVTEEIGAQIEPLTFTRPSNICKMNTPNFSGLVYTIKSGSVKLAL
jgi:hypothetical protein